MREISRKDYAAMYGPTTGDRMRLADTSLIIEIEKDYCVYGDEAKFGGGKSTRDGMGQSAAHLDAECLDLVITSAIVIDSTGIYKADIGIRNGRIAGIHSLLITLCSLPVLYLSDSDSRYALDQIQCLIFRDHRSEMFAGYAARNMNHAILAKRTKRVIIHRWISTGKR